VAPNRSIPIAVPSFDDQEWLALREPFQRGWVAQGPCVSEFEAAFAARHGVTHAAAVSSGTTALHLALLALGVGPGDEVVVPSFTWIATANAAVYCGAAPVFVDVLPDTYNIDPDAIAAAVTDRTAAVIAVHQFGLCADMDAVRRATPPGTPIIEDAACAAGAALHRSPAGSLGDIACFSFHPRKLITTGEGGMVATNDPAVAAQVKRLRNHGTGAPNPAEPFVLPDFTEVGFNYRLTDLQAAMGLVQLAKLDGFIEERRRWAHWYREELAAIPWLQLPIEPDGYRHAWQSFVTVVGPEAPCSRNELMQRLHDRGIGTRPGSHALTELTVYRRRCDLRPGQFPTAASLHARSLALPLHNTMTADDYAYVVEALRAIDRERSGR